MYVPSGHQKTRRPSGTKCVLAKDMRSSKIQSELCDAEIKVVEEVEKEVVFKFSSEGRTVPISVCSEE